MSNLKSEEGGFRSFDPSQATEFKFIECEACGNHAKFQCPTCIKLKIGAQSHFCSQECFKGNWDEHKLLHKLAKASLLPTSQDGLQPLFPGYSYTGPLRAYPQSARRTVPDHIPRPDYATHPKGESKEEQDARGESPRVLTDEEIEGVRLASRLARECLDTGMAAIAVGTTTDELDRLVHEAAIERECYPSPLNYYQFPKSCCTSVNEVICHGIPDLRPIEDGDVVNIDVTVFHRGFHGDLNETSFAGANVSDKDVKLVHSTFEALDLAIQSVRPGVKFREFGNIIQKRVAQDGFSVVRRYCGHGIHRLFHTSPSVPHYAKNRAPGVVKAKNIFTIEPMINAGSWQDDQWPDNWTAVTTDGQRSAQFEQTLLATEDGVEILTARPDGKLPWYRLHPAYEQAKKNGSIIVAS